MARLNRDQAEAVFSKLEITPSFSTNLVSGLVRMDGRVVTVIHYPNGNFDMPEHAAERIRRALHLSPAEFERFAQCYMSKLTYLGLLRDRVEVVSPPRAVRSSGG